MANPKYKEWITKEGLLKIEGWAREGLIEEQIAHNMGIGVSTLSKYKVDHLEILEALKRGKEVVDFEVENALLKRALGGKYKETIKEMRDGKQHVKIVEREVPPDTVAAIFWLKNRKPKDWRDKRETELSTGESINIIFEGVKDD